MLDAYIFDGTRTPFGRHAGALAHVRPDDLAATVIRTIVERSPFDPAQIEDVILGCACQAGEDGRNVARFAGLLAGLPVEAGGQTVNRLCGSGMSAVIEAAHAVTVGEGELFVAGGVESMTRAPFALAKSASAFVRTGALYDTAIGMRFPNARFVAEFGDHSMPATADEVARELGITREASDRYAFASQQRFERARKGGFLDAEITPVTVPAGRGRTASVERDEHPRPDTTLEKMESLSPLDPNGVVTAANASGINDGAVALLIGSREAGRRAGVRARARIVASAVAGVSPRTMGLGPAFAIPKALERAGIGLDEASVIEINEAFAPQVLGCLKLLGIDAEDERLNPNGGAIAVGHPLGASGARIVLTALRQLEATGGRYGVLSLCVGLGQGIALVIERLSE